MKLLKTLAFGSLALPALSAFAAVDLATLAHDAADNVFSGKNYSWTSIDTRPDGGTVAINGQAAGDNVALGIQDGTTSRNLVVVNGVPYVSTDSGWKKAGPPRPPGGMAPPDGATPPPTPPPPPPPDGDQAGGPGGHRGHGGPRGFGPGPRPPGPRLTHLLTEVSSWTADGDVLTGQFSGTVPPPPRPPGGAVPPSSPDGPRPAPKETGVIKLWIQGGVLTKAQVTSTVTVNPPGRDPITHQRDEITTFSAVGTTTVTLPAELQALISKPTS